MADVEDGTVIDALGTGDEDDVINEWIRKLNIQQPSKYSVNKKEFMATDAEIDALIRYINKNLHIYAPGSPYRGNAR